MTTLNPLPDYVVRESTRAKHVHLRVSARAGLEVVVPVEFDRRHVPALLREKAAWIARALREVDRARDLALPDSAEEPPGRIVLRAIGETWTVDLGSVERASVSVRECGDGRLRIEGRVGDPVAWRPVLRRWVMRKARRHLVPWLESEAAALGVRVDRVSIRSPKSRWGSFSSRGTVSLNAQLLFLPPELVRYVLVHELCHATHPDHSPHFWRLVERHVPDAQALRSTLRDGWQLVPDWMHGPACGPDRSG
ncbi:MAG: SprT family zinc-dependent metalloprotease [Candidatus Bipolaricaulota bacterium]|nr:SprT family zinc-dependent metalloprotease [Candidatus Bipolaricaulota bacterium]